MTAEQRFFLALLRDHVNGCTDARLPSGLDWNALYEIAQAQSLTGVVYAQLKALNGHGADIPQEAWERFRAAFLGEVYYAANRAAAMRELGEAFEQKNIAYLHFKGWVVKDCWPVPELRTMGDVDLLIHTGDRSESDAALLALGYTKFVDNHAVWTYTRQDEAFELHDHMFYEYLANEVDYRGYFDRAWEFVDTERWDSFHFLYVLAHTAKHIINSGIGLRAFLDLGFCLQYWKLDWDWLRTELEGLRLWRFAQTCLALCRALFGQKAPFGVPELETSFLDTVTEKLFRDGTFGLENEQHRAAHAAKEIRRSPLRYEAAAWRLTLYKLFPPYEDLQLIPWYSFVDGRPWLTPAAWLYRWFYVLCHKAEHGASLLTEPFAERERILQRQQYIGDWGL